MRRPIKFLLALSLATALGCDVTATPISPTPGDGRIPEPELSTHGQPDLAFTVNGDFASAFIRNGNVLVSLFVGEGGEPGRPVTTLSYVVFEFGTGVLEWGRGEIPNEDLEGSFGGGMLRLETNTSASANPDFDRIVGSGGPISVEWHKTDDFLIHRAGTTRIEFGGGVTHLVGTFTTASASSEGTVLGFPVNGAFFARLGMGHQLRIRIEAAS